MPQFQGFNIWVEMGGVKLEEYQVEINNERRSVECWIPCEAGKEFQIGLVVMADRYSSTNHLTITKVDGKWVRCPRNIIRQNQSNANIDSPARYNDGEVLSDGTRRRKFKFGVLELTDDDDYLDIADKQVGEIEIRVASVQRFELNSERRAQPDDQTSDLKIHERSKKGLAHCVKFGEAEPVPAPTSFVTSIGKQFICKFIFKYRHMDILVAKGIAPRRTVTVPRIAYPPAVPIPPSTQSNATASSSSSGTKRSIERVEAEEDDEEDSKDGIVVLMEAQSRLQVLEAEVAALRETVARASGSGQPSKRVKREAKSTLIPGEVIDLTL